MWKLDAVNFVLDEEKKKTIKSSENAPIWIPIFKITSDSMSTEKKKKIIFLKKRKT